MSAGPKNARELHDILGPLQEKKGYYFNHEQKIALGVLEQLLVTKQRHGYMVCPCRLANSEREKNQDIACPCVYRTQDVAEYGTCYCGLYVSREWNDKKTEFRGIPDRRPVENIFL